MEFASVSGSRILSITELAYEQLKARGGIIIYSNAQFESKELSIYQRNPQTILKSLINRADVKSISLSDDRMIFWDRKIQS